MEEYAKYISETSVSFRIPSKVEFEGRVYTGDLRSRPDILKTIGFLRLIESEQPTEIPENHHCEERYELNETHTEIIKKWIIVEDEKRNLSLSRRKIMNEIKRLGIWTQVKEFLIAKNLWEDFEMSTTLDEQEPLMQNAINALKDAFQLTNDDIEEILTNSVADF